MKKRSTDGNNLNQTPDICWVIALKSEATSILLDNFKPEVLADMLQKIRLHSKGANMYVELSGGITADTLQDFCIDGVNGISMGALTHNIKSKDISLDIK